MEALYLVAILPPEPVDMQIRQFKQEFAERFPTFKSATVLPHITLIPPFKEDSGSAGFLVHDLTELCSDCPPFLLTLSGFQHFGSHTIYASVGETIALSRLFSNLARGSAHPHMTIGYRNKNRKAFPLAWQAFENRPFEATFAVTSYWLLRFEHSGWQPFREIPLLKAS
ncbi:2'-5' RNA ligase family protein [Taibaiella koreensis]|uniref:2'-5' RNA ligase family protein n=1 Tax=Taibaiella koreensis TaxID=1268548 RepID=UPI000E59E939|nr:2'-5' RNA ligase family protein [Taibaiella koreensis]